VRRYLALAQPKVGTCIVMSRPQHKVSSPDPDDEVKKDG
jgi:hypothetical protein